MRTGRPAGERRNQARAAIEAVARRFSARWDGDPTRAHLSAAGKRVALELVVMGGDRRPPPRLRLDRVAVRVVEHLRSTLGAEVPEGLMVAVTITAPIRLASKTATAIADEVRALLARRPRPREVRTAVHGNRIRIRLARAGPAISKVIGFVHNRDADPGVLLDLSESLISLLGERAGAEPPKASAGGRWLVLLSAGDASHVATYRHIHSQLHVPARFGKILMVFAGGRVEALE